MASRALMSHFDQVLYEREESEGHDHASEIAIVNEAGVLYKPRGKVAALGNFVISSSSVIMTRSRCLERTQELWGLDRED